MRSRRGTGRPLVLLHGITLRADVWAPQFHQLADRYRVIAVDLRGHGTSKAGTAGYGIGRLADDLAALLIGLDLHHAVVVGRSMGGMTVMQFCGAHPDVLAERVDGLVFVATRAHQGPPPVRGQRGPGRAGTRPAHGVRGASAAGSGGGQRSGSAPRVRRPSVEKGRAPGGRDGSLDGARGPGAVARRAVGARRPRRPLPGDRDPLAGDRGHPRHPDPGPLGPAPRAPAPEVRVRGAASGRSPAHAGAA